MSRLLTTRRLALLGTIGPILFVAVASLLTVLEWDFLHRLGWDLIRDNSVPYPSATALGPYGWLQIVNFAQLGLAVIAIAIGLFRVVQPRPRVGAAFVVLAGIALLFSTFKTDPSTDRLTTWHGLIHGLAFYSLALSTLVGAVVLAFTLRKVRGWRVVAVAGIALPVLLITVVVLSGAVKQAGGLLGIILILFLVGWYELLAVRLLTLTSGT